VSVAGLRRFAMDDRFSFRGVLQQAPYIELEEPKMNRETRHSARRGKAHKPLAIRHRCSRLERPQEVDNVLLLSRVQLTEALDDLVCLALAAPVSFDCLQQIACPPIMKEENPLSDAP
jgi:hypothetical protein